MEIKPIKQEYDLAVANHTMRATVLHEDNERHLNYYFDDKLVAQKTMPAGQYYTDDECISEAVDEYRKNNVGVYADLLNRHVDKIHLKAKLVEIELINYGITIKGKVKIVKDYYEIELSTENEENVFSGRVNATNFSEALEKMRMFVNTLDGVNKDLTQNISLLSNDKIEEVISWE